jgi:hypothetical protein
LVRGTVGVGLGCKILAEAHFAFCSHFSFCVFRLFKNHSVITFLPLLCASVSSIVLLFNSIDEPTRLIAHVPVEEVLLLRQVSCQGSFS